MNKDYYKILGVAEFDTAENIKSAYRKLARKLHPDIAGETSDAILRFKEINEAYEILSNKIKREEYDRARRFYNYARDNSNKENKVYNNEINKQTKKAKETGKTKEKSFNFNWNEFVFQKKQQSEYKKEEKKITPINGSDIYSDIEISYDEALNGTIKTLNMLQRQVCPICQGRKFANGFKCTHCNGKGETSELKKFNIKIPAGIANKSKFA